MNIRRYSPDDNSNLATLFESCFSQSPAYWAFADSLFNNPAFKLGGHVLFIAESDGQIIGFSHGGSQGIFCVGVHPDHQRKGYGRKLVAALKLSLGPNSKFDWQCQNPFWGNSVNIRSVPFGMVEGIGIESSAPEAPFFKALGAKQIGTAVNFSVTAENFNADKAREKRQQAEAQGFEFGMMQNRAPQIGSLLTDKTENPSGRYFTATALHGQVVAGRCIAFAQPELGAGRFGIWELEVLSEHHRRGVAAALIWNVYLDMQSGEFSRCEVTTVPHLSPNAEVFYKSLGFERTSEFALFE